MTDPLNAVPEPVFPVRRAVEAGEKDEIRFIATDNPYLPGTLPGDIWAVDGAAHAAITERRGALEEASGS